jgi:integrase
MTGDKSKETLKAYKSAVEMFRDHSGVTYMNEITGDVLRAHKIWLFANLKKHTHGKKINTVANRFRYLSVFLAKNGIQMTKGRVLSPDDKGLLDRSDVPRELKGEPVFKYSEAEINAMLDAADIDEADLIQTLLRTGFRDEEIAYLHWADVDFKRDQITISEKPKYEWRPKGRQARTLELEDGVLLNRLQARKERQKPISHLVFPNTLNEPDAHLIRRLYNVVAKAEANGFKFEGRITQHRFRKTFASMMMATCDLQTVSELLGHRDIKTTIRYLAPDRSKARQGSRTAFSGIKG